MTGPSHEPLDDQERELARILRALPGSEPPAALDQRILRAAADAAASSRRPARRWLAFGGAGWGIGSAAAAVLALGVGWHLLDPARNLPMERSAPVAAPAQEDSISVDLGEPSAPAAEFSAPAPTTMPASPPPAPASAQPARPSLRRAPAEAPAFAASPPPPPPAPAAAAAPMLAEPTVQGAAAATAAAEVQAQRQQEAMAGLVESRSREAEADRAEATLAAKQSKAADAAAAANTGAMTPARWLAEVRSLRDANRRAEAADSLRRFHQYYPQYAIPADLLPLMRE